MVKSTRNKKNYSFTYFILILFWIALPEMLFLLINKEPLRFLLNTLAFFSLFLLPIYFYRNHLRLIALLLSPIIVLSLINLACIYYYHTPIVDYLLVLIINTNVQESAEFIKEYIWTGIIITTIYLFVYGYLISKIKDKISSKNAGTISLISLLVILLLPYKDNLDKKYYQKIIGTYYDIFPTSIIKSAKSVYNVYHIVNTNQPIKKAFKFNATQQSNNNERQIHVLVIGESARFDNWTRSGYNRKTTPRIDTTANLSIFNNTHSSAFITEFAVPIMLTGIDPNRFEEHSKQNSIIGAFNEAGFKTYWISNQQEEGNVKLHSSEAETIITVGSNIFSGKSFQDDFKLIKLMDSVIAMPGNKKFIVLHIQGSHFSYKIRFPNEFDVFKPSNKTIATSPSDYSNKQILINSYDNTILYTDFILDNVIQRLKKQHIFSSMFYMSDHGENLMDDSRHLVLHGYPEPSKYISWVPFVIWTSNELKSQVPEKIEILNKNLHKKTSTENLFFTFTDLVGIQHKYSDSTKSICSKGYKERTINMLGKGFKLYNTDSLK